MKYISLGYFCSIAIDLEKLGLRTESSPFDWVISDFEGVMLAIQERFVDFLNDRYLAQSRKEAAHYKNTKYNISFFHDFDRYIPLKEQLPKVQEKYNRRIHRFYQSISEPTLFIRYISDQEMVEGKSKELIYIEQNYEQILAVLKSFHAKNEILFIANEGVSSDKLVIYPVQKDKNDLVARSPLYKNAVLLEQFSRIDLPGKQENIRRYRQKEKDKTKIFYRLKSKVTAIGKRLFLKEYIHESRY
ncbi:MAG: hypothetical protein IKM28_06770 [Lachnospiraceae bacterium]|nr:hypothetical protein [Lachnospiraceae bacterium]